MKIRKNLIEIFESMMSCANCKHSQTEESEDWYLKFQVDGGFCSGCENYSKWEHDGLDKDRRWKAEL